MKTVLIIFFGILIGLLLMAVKCLDLVYYFRREEKKRNFDSTEEEQKQKMKNFNDPNMENEIYDEVVEFGETVTEMFNRVLNEKFPAAKYLNEEEFRRFRNICATEVALQIRESMDVYGLPIPEEIKNDNQEDSAIGL